jgi:hypothetical protein
MLKGAAESYRKKCGLASTASLIASPTPAEVRTFLAKAALVSILTALQFWSGEIHKSNLKIGSCRNHSIGIAVN